MGVSSRKMVYDFRRKFNAALSGRNIKIPVVDIIAYLNEAQETWYRDRIPKAGIAPSITNDLRVFKVTQRSLSILTVRPGKLLAKYPRHLYKRLNQEVVATCKICPNIKKEFPILIVQTDDISPSRKDTYLRADFQYEQLPAEEANDGLYLHVDGAFEVENVVISYYRKPREIHAPSLSKCDDQSDSFYYIYNGDKISKDQDFEVDNTYAYNTVVDIAVLYALRDHGEINDFQTQLQKNLNQ